MSSATQAAAVTPPQARSRRILIADDQTDVLEALRLLLKAEGYAIETATSPAGIVSAVEAREFDVVLMDLNYARDTTSGQEGLDLLTRLQGLDASLPIVVMTAWGSVDLAVGQAGQLGLVIDHQRTGLGRGQKLVDELR